MLTPETYCIPWEKLVRASNVKELIFEILRKHCVCEHSAYKHHRYMQENLMTLTKEFIFTDCNAVFCKCRMFKQDNLKWLESLLHG